tara:strand:- start:326 stop:514 length:189 start_codon:yes stop_codon:yes gene_type:complete
MRKKRKNLLLLFCITFICYTDCYAQLTPIPPPPPGIAELPIDGGIFLLIASAIIYGVKKTRN